MKEFKKELAFRATRDDTLEYQKELRHLLEELITENRPLKTGERDNYLDLLGKALLGIDSIFPNPLTPAVLEQLWEQEVYSKIKTMADFLRYMAYVEGQPKSNLTLTDYWKKALECVLNVSSKALEVATKISAEHIPRTPTEIHGW